MFNTLFMMTFTVQISSFILLTFCGHDIFMENDDENLDCGDDGDYLFVHRTSWVVIT